METSEKSAIQITSDSLNHLSETRKWTMFMSIAGLIFIGFCIILVPILIFSSGSSGSFGFKTTAPIISMAVVYAFPIYYLLKFSINSKNAIQNSDNTSLETSFKYLKLHYRFMGILFITIICIYLIAAIVFVITDFFKSPF